MNGDQINAVNNNIKEIIDCIQTNLENALLDFVENGGGPSEMSILSRNVIDQIRSTGIPYAQTQELIRVLKVQDRGFTALTAALTRYGSSNLATTLHAQSAHNSTWTRQQLAVVLEKKPELLKVLSAHSQAWAWFQSKGYITTEYVDNIEKDQRGEGPTRKASALLTVLSRATSGWHGLNTYLAEHNHESLNSALKEAERQLSEEPSTTTKQSSSSAKTAFQRFLREWTIKECELIKKQWSDTLNVTGLEEAFVRLNSVDLSTTYFSAADLNNFQFLFGPEKRIIISADPGMGKSTILHKIAHDWATEKNDALSKTFDQVFLVRLGSARGETICDLIEYELNSTAYGKCIVNCLEHPIATFRTLLIFDALDELQGVTSVAVKQLLNMEALKAVKCVISTRTSHVDHIPRKHLWFQIEGFGLAEQKEFIGKQLKDSPAADRMMAWYSNMHELVTRPLFLTIACVLAQHKQKSHAELAVREASALFELMKHYYEWLFYIAKNVKGLKISEDEFTSAMIESGKLAFERVITQQKRRSSYQLLRGIKPGAADPKILELASQLGIVTKQLKRKTSKHKVRIKSHGFMHQLFAEYLCAFELSTRCQKPADSVFRSWATMLQGKGFSADRLANALDLRHSPVSYFLTGLSTDYAEAALASSQLFHEDTIEDFIKWRYLPWCCDVRLSDAICTHVYKNIGHIFGPDPSTFVSSDVLQLMYDNVHVVNIAKMALDRRWVSLQMPEDRIELCYCILPAEAERSVDRPASLKHVNLLQCKVENFRWILLLPLTELHIEYIETADWVGLAAALSALAAQLEELHLRFRSRIFLQLESDVSPAEVHALIAATGRMQRLRELTLSCPHLTGVMLGVLADGSLATSLRNLEINTGAMNTHSCAGLKALFPLLEMCYFNEHDCLAECACSGFASLLILSPSDGGYTGCAGRCLPDRLSEKARHTI